MQNNPMRTTVEAIEIGLCKYTGVTHTFRVFNDEVMEVTEV